ncbi:MAG: hypothetical protein HXN36_06875 [Prevotella histicola]|jgi:hypothetical protein|uniref:hypothetical protein n=1 Tax=Prevotella histicola TaxID=470565 RepID=UPI001CACFE2D|nr:hypothetical protein [Prevotella histicola]MBF1394658.1 hypothetical protein [Prevotella histicola]
MEGNEVRKALQANHINLAWLSEQWGITPQALIVKDRNGKGIAKMNVSVTDAQNHPIFYISGIVYK